MPPTEPNEEEKLQELPQDNQTPFSPAVPPRDAAPADAAQPAPSLDPTHPSTDTNIQPEEVYEAGMPAAAEASEPNPNQAVIAETDPANPSVDSPDDNEDPNPEIEDTAL
jgi:hypothetical protein